MMLYVETRATHELVRNVISISTYLYYISVNKFYKKKSRRLEIDDDTNKINMPSDIYLFKAIIVSHGLSHLNSY